MIEIILEVWRDNRPSDVSEAWELAKALVLIVAGLLIVLGVLSSASTLLGIHPFS